MLLGCGSILFSLGDRDLRDACFEASLGSGWRRGCFHLNPQIDAYSLVVSENTCFDFELFFRHARQSNTTVVNESYRYVLLRFRTFKGTDLYSCFGNSLEWGRVDWSYLGYSTLLWNTKVSLSKVT